MLFWLLLSFIVVPLVELAAIDWVAQRLTWGPTLVLLILDSLIGAVLVRREGQRAWTKFRQALDAGRWPGDEVVQGALVLVGGALLLTPGFVTDVLGLTLVLPPTRALYSRFIRARFRQTPMGRMTRVVGSFGDAPDRPSGSASGDDRGVGDARPDEQGRTVYDVEVVSVERDEPRDERDGDGEDDLGGGVSDSGT